MTPLVAAGASVAMTLLAWLLVQPAARARGIRLGSLPLPVLAASAAVTACAHPAASIAPGTIAVIAAVSIAAVIDRRCGAIFDRLTCTLALVALLVASATGTIVDALCGAGMTGGALAALFFCTQRRGIGLGDVKLAAGIGAGLGGVSGLVALGVAFVIGGAYGSWLLGTRRATRGTRIRFGPFVAAGTYIAVLVPVHAR